VSLPVHFREVQHDWGPTDWKLRAIRKEREAERSQISQKDFGWRNAGAVKRRVMADWESVKKRPIESDMILNGSVTISGHVPMQRTQLRS